jgi:hypothetical protein
MCRKRVTEEIAEWEGCDLEERVRRLVALVAQLNIENRPVLRSILLRIWRDPGRHDRLAGEIGTGGFDRLLLRKLRSVSDGEGSSAERERRVRWVMEIMAVTCRHELLFGALHDAEIGDRRVDELLGFLTRLAHDGITAGGSGRRMKAT